MVHRISSGCSSRSTRVVGSFAATMLTFALVANVYAEPVPGAEVAPDVAHGEAARVLKALELPAVAHRARQAGVQENELLPVLGLLDETDAAETAAEVIAEQAAAADEGLQATGLGEFVTAQVRAGIHGQELAQAIRTERDRRRASGERGSANGNRGQGGSDGSGSTGVQTDGSGRGEGAGQGGGRPDGAGQGGGRPDGAGQGGGRPDGAGQGGGRPEGSGQGGGRPDGAGQGGGRPDGAGQGGGRPEGSGRGGGRPDGAGRGQND